jgi:release factor glutamine methyltransferase
MKLLEVLEKTSLWFTNKGIPDARLDAQYIIAHTLGLTRLELYTNYDRPLSELELTRLREFVARRGKREPLQHILGSTPFRKIELKCDSRALIPRVETELLLDIFFEYLKQYAQKNPNGGAAPAVLDIGTGTGAIALSVKKEIPAAQVVAVDISASALALAKENAKNLQLDVQFMQSDLTNSLCQEQKFDCILSNPPYLNPAHMQSLQAEVQFDPATALLGGDDDGLGIIKKILQQAPQYLHEGGFVILEIGYDQAELIQEIKGPLACVQVRSDYSGVPRFAVFQ